MHKPPKKNKLYQTAQPSSVPANQRTDFSISVNARDHVTLRGRELYREAFYYGDWSKQRLLHSYTHISASMNAYIFIWVWDTKEPSVMVCPGKAVHCILVSTLQFLQELSSIYVMLPCHNIQCLWLNVVFPDLDIISKNNKTPSTTKNTALACHSKLVKRALFNSQ